MNSLLILQNDAIVLTQVIHPPAEPLHLELIGTDGVIGPLQPAAQVLDFRAARQLHRVQDLLPIGQLGLPTAIIRIKAELQKTQVVPKLNSKQLLISWWNKPHSQSKQQHLPGN